jgi:hypothetical protein
LSCWVAKQMLGYWIMKRKYKFFEFDYGDGVMGKCLWFRIYGYGVHFKKHDGKILFSERYGYMRYFIFWGIKVKFLKPRLYCGVLDRD